MPHQYKFVGGNYEGARTTVLYHETLFTEDEFRRMVVQATPIALLRKANQEGPIYNSASSLGDIHSEIVEVLCSEQGFQTTTFAVEFAFFNWVGMDGESFKHDTDPNAEAMVQAIRGAGFPPEFFAEWAEFRSPFQGQPYYDSDYEFGLDAGLAFRLNEIVGWRVFTEVTRRPVYEEE